jgi:predicted DNA-binding transcriptional regulator
MYQATLSQGWINSTATAGSPEEAINELKEHIVSEIPWLDSEYTIDEAFDQYMMYKRLGV